MSLMKTRPYSFRIGVKFDDGSLSTAAAVSLRSIYVRAAQDSRKCDEDSSLFFYAFTITSESSSVDYILKSLFLVLTCAQHVCASRTADRN